jgi:dipeptidyl aminopeptidase/acylaminoacyl peptidase
MRPRFTPQKALLLLAALAIFGGLALWVSRGAPLPGPTIPSTAGKIAFVSDQDGNAELWLIEGTGAANADRLTNDPQEDRSPAWSPDGQDLAFISNRRGGYQVFLLEARPGADPRPLTITSSSKDSPAWGNDGRVYYLASGQLVATTPGTSDADAIFPTADARRLPGDPLATGGFSWARPSPDTRSVAAVLRLESGEALLLSPPGAQRPLFLGLAQGIAAAWMPDGTLVAAFRGGTLIPAPVPLPQDRQIPPAPDVDRSFLVQFGRDGTVQSATELPSPPTGLAVSPDGKQAATTAEEGPAGVVLLPVGAGEGKPVFKQAATDPSWSPDGKTLAFASEGDIWTLSAGGTDAAKNLTGGKMGSCSSPAWSPAKTAE